MRLTNEISDPVWQDIWDRDEEIESLRAQLAAAESRLTFVPSPEQWQETQAQLRAAKERLATAEARIAELESRPIKNMGQIVREFSEHTEPSKKEVGE